MDTNKKTSGTIAFELLWLFSKCNFPWVRVCVYIISIWQKSHHQREMSLQLSIISNLKIGTRCSGRTKSSWVMTGGLSVPGSCVDTKVDSSALLLDCSVWLFAKHVKISRAWNQSSWATLIHIWTCYALK